MKLNKTRNEFVDSMRGVAMLLVILGHTMTGCTVDSQSSFLFNVVWSLQMPLFILISGYVTKYSNPICNASQLINYVKRRTIAYMLPFCVWSFLIRGILFAQYDYLNIKYLLWHMDSGYWFLTTIWTISMIFGLAGYVAERLGNGSFIKKQIVLLVVYLAGMFVLTVVGLAAGLAFFAIKLTLYYMPFYYAGYLFGQFDETILAKTMGRKVIDCMIAISFAFWLFITLRFSLYEVPDGVFAIGGRAATSLAGCIAVTGLLRKQFLKTRGILPWLGRHSLEIYLVHYLCLCLIPTETAPNIISMEGWLLVLLNFCVTVVLTCEVVYLLNQNSVTCFLLFGKRK